jgi:hypothetical protein
MTLIEYYPMLLAMQDRIPLHIALEVAQVQTQIPSGGSALAFGHSSMSPGQLGLKMSLLMDEYLHAVSQMTDAQGWLPLHRACENSSALTFGSFHTLLNATLNTTPNALFVSMSNVKAPLNLVQDKIDNCGNVN